MAGVVHLAAAGAAQEGQGQRGVPSRYALGVEAEGGPGESHPRGEVTLQGHQGQGTTYGGPEGIQAVSDQDVRLFQGNIS